MGQIDEIQKGIQQALDALWKYIEKSTDNIGWEWSQDNEDVTPIIFKAILRRQFESLSVISHLVKEKKGFVTVPLLRPSCEEFIWTKYLVSIPRDIATEIFLCMELREIHKSLEAEKKFQVKTYSKFLD